MWEYYDFLNELWINEQSAEFWWLIEAVYRQREFPFLCACTSQSKSNVSHHINKITLLDDVDGALHTT